MSDDLGRTDAERLAAVEAPVVGGCELHERLGQGGMGTVYRATQRALGREVAVKVVPAAGVSDDLVARFKREARTAAALEHPHSIPIYAAGEDDGLLYLVMRRVNGPDLGTLIAEHGPLAPTRAVALIEQLAGALDAAHAAGLVHRDVKPANILVEPRAGADYVYLSDFGLMREIVGATAITRVGEWVGSVDYVAPEQIEGDRVDARADVYALTGVLFTALTGRPPFVRPDATAVARAHRHDAPPSLGRGHEAMSAVIARGMAKAPGDRFSSAGALARAAAAALPGRPPARARGRGRWAGLALAAIALAAGIAVAAVLLTRSHHTAATPPPPVPPSPGPTFAGHGFAFHYPAGWQVVENQRPLGPFIRTKVVSPDGRQVLIVDRTPNDQLTPLQRAINVSQSLAQHTPGYQPGTLAPATLNGRRAFTWSFALSGQPLPTRFDVFQRLGTSGYAVLAEGSDARRAASLALTVARSLEGS